MPESNPSLDERFDRLASPAGTMLLDLALTTHLRRGGPGVHLAQAPYAVPVDLRAAAETRLRAKLAGRTNVYDGPLLGCATDLRVAPSALPQAVELVRGTYFQHLATDLVPVDNLVQLRPGAQLHAIGVSALAITADNHMLFGHQTVANLSSAGMLAPSGSGSLEPEDFAMDAHLLRQVLLTGARRELLEETGLHAADLLSIETLGIAHWLDKAGKSEFFALTRLRVPVAAVLGRTVKHGEAAYHGGLVSIPMDTLWPVRVGEMNLDALAELGTPSLPLLTGLRHLVRRTMA